MVYSSHMKFRFVYLIIFFGVISCSKQEARRPISATSSGLLESTTALLKKINTIEEIKIKNYIKKDSLHDYIRSSYGFWYHYIVKNKTDTITPSKEDVVSLTYDVLDLSDQVLYSKELIGVKEYIVDKEDFIPGLQYGIKLMKEGESIKFIIPSFNAYGVLGDENKIGMNTSIISRVTLININKNE